MIMTTCEKEQERVKQLDPHSMTAHPANQLAWDNLVELAASHGLIARINHTTKHAFTSWYAYLLLTPPAPNPTIRSRDCQAWEKAPYARYYRPSLHSEQAAISRLRCNLEGE